MLDKLEAVNRSLQAIGEARVNSLSSGLPDAAEAEAVLDEVTNEVLSSGWFENTREDVTVKPDTLNNEITISSSWLLVEVAGASRRLGAVTAKVDLYDGVRKLYHVQEDTFKFSSDVTLKVIMGMSFDNMTFPLRNYVSARAARTFQERILGSQSLDSFTGRAEAAALAKLQDAEAEVAEHNVLTDNAYMRLITARNNQFTWR